MTGPDDRDRSYQRRATIAAGVFLVISAIVLLATSRLESDKLGIVLVAGLLCLGVEGVKWGKP